MAKEDAIKELEIATARYNELKESYDAAVSDEAKANLLRKVQEAERVKNQAVDNLYLKQARLDDVNNRISNKQNEINAKTQELTIKNADLSTKRNTYNSIQQTVNQKQQQLAQATLNKTNKENEQRQAEQALEDLKAYKAIQDQKIETLNNKIIENNQKINQLTAENRRYQELITQIEAEARQGAVGFIMSRNDEAAKNLLTSWIEQGLVTFYPNKDTRNKVLVSKELIDAQNENSAFSKENFRKAIKLAIRINAKRMVSDDIELSQDGTKDVKVSDFYMAYSALSANAAIQVEYHPGVAVKKHYSNGSESSYSLNENLAMGYKYSNPENDVLNAVRAWYDAEKINFEAERDGRPINYKEIEERDYVLAGIVKDTQGQTGHYTYFISRADYLGTGFNKLTSKNGYISASVMNYDDVMENRYITGTEQTIANLKAIQTSQNMAVAPEEYLASYDAYIANLETRLNKARENIGETTNEINTTRFKIVELNTELNNLQREFNDGSYNGRVEDIKRTIENKKAEVLQATQNVQTKTDALRAEQNKLEQQLETITTVESVIQNIQNSLSGLNRELNILNNEKNTIQEDISNAQDDVNTKTTTFNEEARKLEESNRELAQLTRDYDIATQHKLSKEAILNSTTQRFDELTAQLDSKNNVINTENAKLESLLENKNSTEAIKNDKLSVKNSKQSLYDEVVLNRENINNELIIATKKHNKLLESKNNAQNEVDLAIELKNDRQLKYDNAVRLNSEAKIQYAEIILNKEASDRIYNEKLVKFNEDKVNDDNAKSELAIAKANKDNADKAYEDAINNLSRYSENSIQELKERLYDSKVSLANVKEALRNSQNALEQAKIRLQNATDKLNAKNIELSKQNNKSLNVIPINNNYIEKENKKSDLKTVEKNGDSEKEKVLIPKPTTNKTKDKNVDKKVIVNKDYHNKFLMNLILFVFILSMLALAIFLLFKNKKNNKI